MIAAYGSSNDETIARRSLIAQSLLNEYKTRRELALDHQVSTKTIENDIKAIRLSWVSDIQESGRELFAQAMHILDLLRAAAMEGVESRNWRERDRSIRTAQSIVKDQLRLFGIKDASVVLSLGDDGEPEQRMEVTPEQADKLLELYDSMTVTTRETTVTTERRMVTDAAGVEVMEAEVVDEVE